MAVAGASGARSVPGPLKAQQQALEEDQFEEFEVEGERCTGHSAVREPCRELVINSLRQRLQIGASNKLVLLATQRSGTLAGMTTSWTTNLQRSCEPSNRQPVRHRLQSHLDRRLRLALKQSLTAGSRF